MSSHLAMGQKNPPDSKSMQWRMRPENNSIIDVALENSKHSYFDINFNTQKTLKWLHCRCWLWGELLFCCSWDTCYVKFKLQITSLFCFSLIIRMNAETCLVLSLCHFPSLFIYVGCAAWMIIVWLSISEVWCWINYFSNWNKRNV